MSETEKITVDSGWQDYFKNVFPQGCSMLQEDEMRASYYAGFFNALILFLAISELPKEKSRHYLNEWMKECKDWISSRAKRLLQPPQGSA